MSNELKRIQADKQALLDGLDKGLRRGIAKRLDVPVGKLPSASYADIVDAYADMRLKQAERKLKRAAEATEAEEEKLAAATRRLREVERDIDFASVRYGQMKLVGNLGLTSVFGVNLDDEDEEEHIYIAARDLSEALSKAEVHEAAERAPRIGMIKSITLVTGKGLF
jgi:hypothetical protein